jgi:hypothetical protein
MTEGVVGGAGSAHHRRSNDEPGVRLGKINYPSNSGLDRRMDLSKHVGCSLSSKSE